MAFRGRRTEGSVKLRSLCPFNRPCVVSCSQVAALPPPPPGPVSTGAAIGAGCRLAGRILHSVGQRRQPPAVRLRRAGRRTVLHRQRASDHQHVRDPQAPADLVGTRRAVFRLQVHAGFRQRDDGRRRRLLRHPFLAEASESESARTRPVRLRAAARRRLSAFSRALGRERLVPNRDVGCSGPGRPHPKFFYAGGVFNGVPDGASSTLTPIEQRQGPGGAHRACSRSVGAGAAAAGLAWAFRSADRPASRPARSRLSERPSGSRFQVRHRLDGRRDAARASRRGLLLLQRLRRVRRVRAIDAGCGAGGRHAEFANKAWNVTDRISSRAKPRPADLRRASPSIRRRALGRPPDRGALLGRDFDEDDFVVGICRTRMPATAAKQFTVGVNWYPASVFKYLPELRAHGFGGTATSARGPRTSSCSALNSVFEALRRAHEDRISFARRLPRLPLVALRRRRRAHSGAAQRLVRPDARAVPRVQRRVRQALGRQSRRTEGHDPAVARRLGRAGARGHRRARGRRRHARAGLRRRRHLARPG